MTNDLSALVEQIETELAKLGWLCTDESPTAFCCVAEEALPLGWARVYDDYVFGSGPAAEILKTLQGVKVGAEYGEGLADNGTPGNSREWPEALISYRQIEEGTANDNPLTLIQIQTNGGPRFACGPHGVSECALASAIKYDLLYSTEEEAIAKAESAY